MKSFNYIFCFIVLFLFVTSCSDSLTEKDKIRITREITTIVDNFLTPEINYDSHTNLRANVEGYVMGSDGAIIAESYGEYASSLKEAFKGIDRFLEMKPTKKYVYVLAKDAASCTCEFEGKLLATTGDTIIHNGCWTFVFKQINDQWKVVHENGTHTH
ncbi:MAG: hypothetical protein ABFS16_04280 [Bacteroidota bacterium]